MRFPIRLVTALLFANCSSPKRTAEQKWTPVPSSDLGEVVAQVGPVPIFAKQVEAEARKSGASLRATLDALVEQNLLAEGARARAWSLPGISDQQVESALVQRLLEKELEPKLTPAAVPDEDLRPIYERSRDRFVHPRLVEIGLLAVYTGARMQKADRDPRERTARDLAAYLKTHPAKTLEDFSAIARDPSWSSRKVVFLRTLQGLDRPLSRAVGIEVSKLRAPGETTPLVVDEDGGFIARYISERPPENITLQEVRTKLIAGYYEHWRREKFLEFTDHLAGLHRVQTYPDRLRRKEQGL